MKEQSQCFTDFRRLSILRIKYYYRFPLKIKCDTFWMRRPERAFDTIAKKNLCKVSRFWNFAYNCKCNAKYTYSAFIYWHRTRPIHKSAPEITIVICDVWIRQQQRHKNIKIKSNSKEMEKKNSNNKFTINKKTTFRKNFFEFILEFYFNSR